MRRILSIFQRIPHIDTGRVHDSASRWHGSNALVGKRVSTSAASPLPWEERYPSRSRPESATGCELAQPVALVISLTSALRSTRAAVIPSYCHMRRATSLYGVQRPALLTRFQSRRITAKTSFQASSGPLQYTRTLSPLFDSRFLVITLTCSRPPCDFSSCSAVCLVRKNHAGSANIVLFLLARLVR